MQLDRAFFTYLLHTSPTVELITHLDRLSCQCHYVHHWYYNMSKGEWNPELTDMDFELKGVETIDQLYDFLITKSHDIKEQSQQP